MENNYTDEYLDSLAHKWKVGTLTEEEQVIFDQWYNTPNDNLLELPEGYAQNPQAIRQRMLNEISRRIYDDKARSRKIYRLPVFWLKAIAATLIAAASLALIYRYNKKSSPIQAKSQLAITITLEPVKQPLSLPMVER